MNKTIEERNKEFRDQLGTIGVKYDAGKPRIELVTSEFITGIAEVLTIGADKYDADNWKRGMDWRRVYGAMQRHLTAWLSGEDLDIETGKSHLYHAGCCLMFLTSYQKQGIGEDNRENKVYERLEADSTSERRQKLVGKKIVEEDAITLTGEQAIEWKKWKKLKNKFQEPAQDKVIKAEGD